MYDLGEKLKNLRIKKKFTQEQVAKRIGLHKSSINGYENDNRVPPTEILSKLALFYNVSTDYLLGHDNRKFIYVNQLSDKQIEILESLIEEMKTENKK